MKRKTRKRLVRFIILPFVILLLLVGLAIGILYSQQQRLVKLAVEELNKKIPGMLEVNGSDLSLFQNFPYISIGLKNVQLYAGKSDTVQPIYEAERMYTGLSLPDILKQEFHIKVILLKDGYMNLVQDTAGSLNITEATRISTDTTDTATSASPLDLAIKKFVLKNMDISFLNERNGQLIRSHIDRIQSALTDDSLKITADVQGNMLLDYTHPGDTTTFRHKRVQADIKLAYDKPKQFITLTTGQLKLENAVFNITGTVDLLHDNWVDLSFSGDKPDFRQLFLFAPETVRKELKHFRYDGLFDFQGKIKGTLKGGQLPLIEVSFSCSKAWLHNTQANKRVDSLAFSGYYTNGEKHSLQTSELRILDMRAKPGSGLFKGNFIMRDFTNPKISMQIRSELELEFIGAFLGIKDLERITGHISLKMNLKELVDLDLPQQEMAELTEGVQSELTVSNLTFRVPSYPYEIEHLNLHADMKNGFVKMDSLSFKIGNSDFRMDGSLSDLPALFHHQSKPVTLTFNDHSNKMVLKELLAFDTAKSAKAREEIYGFNIGLSLETSVDELLHPRPLPRGVFKVHDFYAAFKQYPHAFHDFGAELTINDTSLLLRNLIGRIDSSDLRFNGRINNYPLWFEKVKKGTTRIAFDLRSQRLAMNDLMGDFDPKYIPKDYRHEIATNVWLRMRTDLKYDSIFRFANCHIANISGDLMQHPFDLDSLHGNVKFGIDNFIKIDTLMGKIGNSDFNISMRLYAGKDTARRKKENFLQFSSNFLDLDQLANYLDTAEEAVKEEEATDIPNTEADSTAVAGTTATTGAGPETTTGSQPAASSTAATGSASLTNSGTSLASDHAQAFNIFKIPFIDFTASVNIGKIKYHQLFLKNVFSNMRMAANQQLYLDTLGMQVAGGKIGVQAHFDGSDPAKIYLRSNIRVDDVNIEKMMLKLDNLGEDYVINKNIKGRLNGQIRCYVQVHPDLTPLIDNSEAQLDVAIYNGTLVNFAPMQAMASYFKDKNLNMIRFDTLQNTLTFKNGALSFPSMNINSSLGFMEIAGTQSMDMHMEYYLRIPLKMVTQAGFHMLFGKKKEEVDPDQVDAIEYRDKEKRVRFMNLKIVGTPDNYKVSLGKVKKA